MNRVPDTEAVDSGTIIPVG